MFHFAHKLGFVGSVVSLQNVTKGMDQPHVLHRWLNIWVLQMTGVDKIVCRTFQMVVNNNWPLQFWPSSCDILPHALQILHSLTIEKKTISFLQLTSNLFYFPLSHPVSPSLCYSQISADLCMDAGRVLFLPLENLQNVMTLISTVNIWQLLKTFR